MELHTDWCTPDPPGGSVSAYIARAAAVTAPVPAVIVIQEIRGVDDHIEDSCAASRPPATSRSPPTSTASPPAGRRRCSSSA